MIFSPKSLSAEAKQVAASTSGQHRQATAWALTTTATET
jgi:hypothetical protein